MYNEIHVNVILNVTSVLRVRIKIYYIPGYVLQVPNESKLLSALLDGQSFFELQAMFETSALNDPKITLNTIMAYDAKDTPYMFY